MGCFIAPLFCSTVFLSPVWVAWKDRVAIHEGLSERKDDLRVKRGTRDKSMAWQNHYMWAASPHDSQTPQLQPCPNLKWNLFSSLWNFHFRSICPNFHGFSAPFWTCRKFAIFPPATWNLWFVRAASGLLLISSDFLSLGYAPAGFLFGIFPSFSAAIMKETFVSGVLSILLKKIFPWSTPA